jgi:nicotinamide-nucleotide amidase
MRIDDEALSVLARELAARFGGTGCMLATAESCTGGWIAKCLTDIAGSSSWFAGGVVSYSNAAKSDVLGVPETLIDTQGAVSEEVARAMAEGALRAFQADRAVAVTGVAGPTGGSVEKPVGTVWFAWAARGKPTTAERRRFVGDREAVRRKTVAHVFEGLLASMKNPPPTSPSDLRSQGGEYGALPPSRAKSPRPLPPSGAKGD